MDLSQIAKQIKDASENIFLIYAFNSTGKTRLSVEYKEAAKNAAQHGRNGNLYQGSPQYIQMLPKRHLTDLSLIYRLSHICHLTGFSSLMSRSFSTPFTPSLKLRTPLPRPFISSGIFLPPKNSRTISTMKIISCVPIPNIIFSFMKFTVFSSHRWSNSEWHFGYFRLAACRPAIPS